MDKYVWPLKVLYICNSPKIIGGAEKSLMSLLEHFDRKIIQPFFASIHDAELANLVRELGIETFHLSGFEKKNPIPFLYSAIRLSRYIKAEGISLIHANRLPDAFYGVLPAKLAQVRLVIHHRDTSRFSKLDRIIVSNASCNICISNWQNKNFLNGRGVLIPNGIELERFHASLNEGLSENGPVIGLIGRVTPIKGHKTFVDAAKIVLKERPDCQFVMAGEAITSSDREFLRFIKNEIEAAGIDKQIRFIGQVDDVAGLLQMMDISVVPSEREPFGRVIIESMAMKRPVIASSVGGPLDIITPGTGLLIPPNDPEELAFAILKLVENISLRLEMGKNGRELVQEKYTIQKTVEDITSLYTKIFN